MLVFVSMCPGDLTSASVLAAIARPPYYYVIIAFHSFIFLQTVQEKMCSKLNYLQKKNNIAAILTMTKTETHK